MRISRDTLIYLAFDCGDESAKNAINSLHNLSIYANEVLEVVIWIFNGKIETGLTWRA